MSTRIRRVEINQRALGTFVRTDLGMQAALDRGATEIETRVKAATPIGTGMWHGRFMNHPGLARRNIRQRTFRWWRRVQSDEHAAHLVEWGSKPGIDSIGRRHYETPAYRPFTKAAISARRFGTFVPASKGAKGGDDG